MSIQKDIIAKIIFVVSILLFYRIGSFIPVPGINTMVLESLSTSHTSGILGMFNMLTGGALSRMSIFALNIMPYITASIIMQLATMIFDEMSSLKKEGESGRKKINQYTRFLTIFLCIFQSYAIASGIESMSIESVGLVYNPGFLFRIQTVMSLTCGTIVVMWLAEQINIHGIGNGSSLIIFTGIVSGIPSGIITLFEMSRVGSMHILSVLFVVSAVLILLFIVVFIERAQRKINVHYPKRQVGNKLYGGDNSHLPLKINMAGVIPAIFASSLLLFPVTIANFSLPQGKSYDTSEVSLFINFVMTYLSHGKPLYIMLYFCLITFFCFFYSGIIFNPIETSETLQKNGAIILGRRPGKQTAEYLAFLTKRITVIGAIYMSVICIIPELLMGKMNIPFYLGGTSILIVVNVVMDFYTQLHSQFLSIQYGSMMKRYQENIARRKK